MDKEMEQKDADLQAR